MTTPVVPHTAPCSWHTVSVADEELAREVEHLRATGAVITGSRRTADHYVLTYVA